MDADFSELIALSMDLDNVPRNAGPKIRQAVEISARNVKDAAQAKVRGRTILGHAAQSIDYELKGFQGFGATVLDAEIGYNKGKPAGALGNLIEFGAPGARAHMLVRGRRGWRNVPVPGSPSRPLAPGTELQRALAETEDDFVNGLDIAIEDSLREAGL